MNSTIFECNENLVKANCTLQDWQQYCHSLTLDKNYTAGAIFGTDASFWADLGPFTLKEESPKAAPIGVSSKHTRNEFSFDLQDFDSWEGYDPQRIFDSHNCSGSGSDFGRIYEDDSTEIQNPSKSIAMDSEPSLLKEPKTDDAKEHKSKTTRQVRWRKSDDKLLFRELIFITRKFSLTMEEFIELGKAGASHVACDELFEKINWKGSITSLMDRIWKLISNKEYLSYRDFKQLRKLYYQQLRRKNVDWDSLLFEFPGRSLEYIKEVCFSFPRRESILERSSEDSS